MTTIEDALNGLPARPAHEAAAQFAAAFAQAAVSAEAMAAVTGDDTYAADALRQIADASTVEVPTILTRDRFQQFAQAIKVRDNWHEPDEQDVDAVPTPGPWGFDNACGDATEHSVVFYVHGKPTARVSLATLCAWASQEN